MPFLFDSRPQVLAADALMVACRAARLLQGPDGGRPDARLGFNSLAAFASVNHCHLHVWMNHELWGGDRMPVERAPRSLVAEAAAPAAPDGVSTSVCTVQWPIPCLLVQSAGPASAQAALTACAVRVAMAAVEACQGQGLPHNLALWWEGQGQGQGQASLCILLFPRLSQAPSLGGHLNIALLEACGLATVVSVTGGNEASPAPVGPGAVPTDGTAETAARVFRGLTEEQVSSAMAAFAVPQAQFQGLVDTAVAALRQGPAV